MINRPFWVTLYFLMFYTQWMCGSPMAEPPIAPTVIIYNDYGGYVADYNRRFLNYETARTRVILAGSCESACTRYMRLSNVCATPTATFWFHAIHDVQRHIKVEDSIMDSKLNETPAAFALQNKYKVWHFGFLKAKRRPKTVEVEPGVFVIYSETPETGLYQKWLKVKATRFVPAC